MRFGGRAVLVVGGNSGIGLAAARAFAGEGAAVFLTGRDPDTLARAEAAIPGARSFRAEVADVASLRPVLDGIRAAHGRLDVLFVNAGIGVFRPAREVTPELWDEVHGVNLRGCFFAVQQALPLMGRGGAIVVTGSIGGAASVAGNVVYGAAKAGLRHVVRILATELVADGIRVNMVSPGPVETPIINRSGLPPEAVEEVRRQMVANIPMGRMGEADEVARPVLFLASDEASFITGVDLYVDGGCMEL